MLNFRSFTGEIEILAPEYRDSIVTEDGWTIAGDAGEESGEAKGFYVRLDEQRGFAKPSKVRPEKFHAAHEKIASDLAFELGLPVPPVVLWRRPNPAKEDEVFLSISLVPFMPINKWGLVASNAETAIRIGLALKPTASAMVPFDTWVANRDRKNAGNVLVGEEEVEEPEEDSGAKDAGAEGALEQVGNKNDASDKSPSGDASEATSNYTSTTIVRAAYIDYSFSMTERWSDASSYKAIDPAPLYPSEGEPDLDAMKEALSRIEALPDTMIKAIVDRIPDDFLTKERREIIVDGLLLRKTGLRAELIKNGNESQGEQP